MKIFHFDGPSWAFLTPEQMYGEQGKLRLAHKHYQDANIYFLSVMNVCRFNPKKTRVTLNGDLQCEVEIGDPESRTFRYLQCSFPLVDMLHSLPGFMSRFPDRDTFLRYLLLERYLPQKKVKRQLYLATIRAYAKTWLSERFALKILLGIYSREVEVDHDTRYEIKIFDPFWDAVTDDKKAVDSRKNHPDFHALNNAMWDTTKTEEVNYSLLPGAEGRANCRLTIDQIVNHFGLDVGNQRIAYIGKTEQEPFERLFPHTTLNELNSELARNEYESLIIHLFGFRMRSLDLTSNKELKTLTKSEAITITEAELINYFKPLKNVDYVKNHGKPKWEHIKLLLNKKYKSIRGLLEIDRQYARFYTAQVGDQKLNKHEIDVDLNAYRPVSKKGTAKS
ncbi:hypothetical protein LOY52_14640 [Pseudomonas sp. B21-051]|uniref:hypothetical protein n=1 Tax=Pseudomonas sp. B21-051 TaxID=2895491 RepID=UPI00215F3C2F|nr:hypothetical protein [Pseudomonas sp. B21-051]UVK86130.1 hypothetical protein LOY52_14640 [Pseudomonas sp. B21-051]